MSPRNRFLTIAEADREIEKVCENTPGFAEYEWKNRSATNSAMIGSVTLRPVQKKPSNVVIADISSVPSPRQDARELNLRSVGPTGASTGKRSKANGKSHSS